MDTPQILPAPPSKVSEIELESQVFQHSGTFGSFEFQIADTKTPIWKGEHSSGGSLALYRAKVTGSPTTPVLVYIYVLWFQDSEGTVLESFVGYRIYSSFMNPERMFEDLMSILDSELSRSGQEYKDQAEKEYERVSLQ